MLVNDVKEAKMTIKKESWDYWQLKPHDMMLVENKNKLIYAVKEVLVPSSSTSRTLSYLTFFILIIWPLVMEDMPEY